MLIWHFAGATVDLTGSINRIDRFLGACVGHFRTADAVGLSMPLPTSCAKRTSSPRDGVDRLGELVRFAQAVGSGIDSPTASAVRKWPTHAPRNRSIRLIEPVKSTVAPAKCHMSIRKSRNAN